MTNVGFSLSGSVRTTPSVTTVTVGGITTYDYIGDPYYSATATIDMDILETVDYTDYVYLRVEFRHTTYRSNANNLVASMSIAPRNFPDYAYEAEADTQYIQSSNQWASRFYFPLKSVSKMSVYSLAKFDTYYPTKAGLNKVPLIFDFPLSGTLDASGPAASSFSFSIVLTLVSRKG